MRLTMMTDYAMRLLIHVAQHPDRLCTIVEVAQVYGISEAHLMKVTHQLALHGWIETVRGKGGGMRLALPAEEIRIGDVVRSATVFSSSTPSVTRSAPGMSRSNSDGSCQFSASSWPTAAT